MYQAELSHHARDHKPHLTARFLTLSLFLATYYLSDVCPLPRISPFIFHGTSLVAPPQADTMELTSIFAARGPPEPIQHPRQRGLW
jgi:hypothetical protein